MNFNIKTIFKGYIFLMSMYLIGDGLLHLLDIKLVTVSGWSTAALSYSKFISNLYGAFAIVMGLLGIETQRDLNKYRNFIYIVACWLAFYGCLLIYTSWNVDFKSIFKGEPSVYVWIPFYNAYLLFEAALCFIFAVLAYLWRKSKNQT